MRRRFICTAAQQYHVEHLDFKERKAYVKQVDVDYYTDAIRYTQVRVLEVAASKNGREASEQRIPSVARVLRSHAAMCWCGRRWWDSRRSSFLRTKILARENWNCRKTKCTRLRTGSRWSGRWWSRCPIRSASGRAECLGCCMRWRSVATLLLMCDGRDLGTAIGERPPKPEGTRVNRFVPMRDGRRGAKRTAKEFFEPNLYLFDAYPGGIGFSEPLFRAHELLVAQTRELIVGCGCEQGCPSCVGPAGDLAPRAKEAALAILDRLCA